MAKYLTVFLICLSINAFAESKQETYYNSCYGSYVIAVINLSNKPQSTIRAAAKDLCQAARERWDREKAWDKMKYPMFSGCWNAMEGVYDPSLDPTIRKAKTIALAGKICTKIGER